MKSKEWDIQEEMIRIIIMSPLENHSQQMNFFLTETKMITMTDMDFNMSINTTVIETGLTGTELKCMSFQNDFVVVYNQNY